VAGAILDVLEREPLPEDDPMWQVENMVISPHRSSAFDGWARATFAMFSDNLRNRCAGKPLFNVLDPLRGY
jgi:phosphoglycerate dehydrogenase-like enzyme